MRKDRLAQFKKKLEEKHRQLSEGVGKTVLYAKDLEDDSTKDLGDQAATSYNREFLFELSNGDRRVLKEVVSALPSWCRGRVLAPLSVIRTASTMVSACVVERALVTTKKSATVDRPRRSRMTRSSAFLSRAARAARAGRRASGSPASASG